LACATFTGKAWKLIGKKGLQLLERASEKGNKQAKALLNIKISEIMSGSEQILKNEKKNEKRKNDICWFT